MKKLKTKARNRKADTYRKAAQLIDSGDKTFMCHALRELNLSTAELDAYFKPTTAEPAWFSFDEQGRSEEEFCSDEPLGKQARVLAFLLLAEVTK